MGTLFHHHVFGAQFMNLFERGEDVVLFSELMRFAVVEHEAIELFD